ncbi:ABC transporter ATP-binding protein [Frankia nepalensis]|uniref:ABC transporter ATP-binding protein n=1 Tax=Frankia nepalensis TaxID=1836974 RepID=A0A937RGV0_9ACTN|nr:ABC transporter ATP-binding protein [Frankia nepalensis]MBL7497351.1 ABC transporter ATP-binding protein [Frankia nepalensis]MBL7510925.1 ABC transporter ATP-binding protein [Frankia nepalensis]MBL7631956.1 ABC transporter ATP-binding protein [Frankia nepalensis]
MLLRLLLPYTRPYQRAVILVALLQVAQTAAALYLPDLSADVIDKGVLTGDTAYIWRLGALMTAVSLAQLVCTVGAARVAARVGSYLARDLRVSLFTRVQSFSARELNRFGAASLTVRTTNDVQQVQMLVQTTLTFMVTAPIMCVGGVVFALAQDAPLSLLLAVVAPVLGGLAWGILRRMAPLSATLQDTTDSVNRIMREQIIGLRVIRAFVQEERENARFDAANARLTDVSARVGLLMALMFPLVTAVASVASVAVVWFGAARVETGAIGVGALSAFLGYVLQILGAAVMMTYLLRMLPRAQVCARRIGEVLDTASTVVPPMSAVAALPRPAHVELRDVGFRYPGAEAPVLDDISITAGRGETVAVIGSTGSGKSTLLSLIPRLADPSEGAVLIGGVDARSLDQTLLSRTIGYVPQRPYLFSGTVATNLRYGDPDATDDDLWWALDIAQARAFVEALPQGLDTPVAQGGTNLSGGQRQRLAIARALVGRPDVYLFDDSFSALDYSTDARLRAALVRHTSGSAVIIVAQRVNTIRGADRIVVLDEGRVVGTGTHGELFAGNATYREIVLSQLTEAEAA